MGEPEAAVRAVGAQDRRRGPVIDDPVGTGARGVVTGIVGEEYVSHPPSTRREEDGTNGQLDLTVIDDRDGPGRGDALAGIGTGALS